MRTWRQTRDLERPETRASANNLKKRRRRIYQKPSLNSTGEEQSRPVLHSAQGFQVPTRTADGGVTHSWVSSLGGSRGHRAPLPEAEDRYPVAARNCSAAESYAVWWKHCECLLFPVVAKARAGMSVPLKARRLFSTRSSNVGTCLLPPIRISTRAGATSTADRGLGRCLPSTYKP